MIEGTRPFRGKKLSEKPPSEAQNDTSSIDDTGVSPPQEPKAASNDTTGEMNRRAWFSSLVPAFGDGLVKILRASNHLQSELKQSAKLTR